MCGSNTDVAELNGTLCFSVVEEAGNKKMLHEKFQDCYQSILENIPSFLALP